MHIQRCYPRVGSKCDKGRKGGVAEGAFAKVSVSLLAARNQQEDTTDFWIPCVFLWRNTVSSHSKENPIYVFLFWELRGLSPNFHIHMSVSDLYIPTIGPHISLQQNRQSILEIYKSLTDI
jgi:hypothetical protein